MRTFMFLFVLATSQNYAIAETVFDNLDATLAGGFFSDTDEVRMAQAFNLGDNHTVNSVTLGMNKFGSPDATLAVEIWTERLNSPGDPVATLGTIDAADVMAEGELGNRTYTFDNDVSGLTPNQSYYVVVSTSEMNVWNPSNNVEWRATLDEIGTYAAGEAQVTSVITNDWHTLRDLPEGGPPVPAFFFTSIDALKSVMGDFDADHLLTSNDIDLLASEIHGGSTNVLFDVNHDGQVNSVDYDDWIHASHFANTYRGDANLDGEFNSTDLASVFQAGLYERDLDAGWVSGDWTGDSRFDTADMIAAFQDGGYELGPRLSVSAVPEPTSACCTLVTMAIMAISSRRKTLMLPTHEQP